MSPCHCSKQGIIHCGRPQWCTLRGFMMKEKTVLKPQIGKMQIREIMSMSLDSCILEGHCCCCCVASVVSDSVRPHRRQPNRLPRPWDSPGKNTGGCHFLLQLMKVKSESEVAQSCPTLSDMDCSLPGSSSHGIFQARVLEWVAIAFSVKAPPKRST